MQATMMRTTVVLACMTLILCVPGGHASPDLTPGASTDPKPCVAVNGDPSDPVTVYNCGATGQGSNIG